MNRFFLATYRLARRLAAPRLSPRDQADMDELIAARLERAGSAAERLAVWLFELADLAGGSARTVMARLGSLSLLDVRIGIRLLLRQPGLSFVALATLMAGIPVGLGPLHAVRAFEMAPDVPEGEHLVVLKNFDSSTQRWESSYLHDYLVWQSLASVTDLGAVATETFNLTGGEDGAQPVAGAITTPSLFEAFATAPLVGRVLLPGDALEGAAPVAVLGHDLWQSRYGADPDVLGRQIAVSGRRHTVVGVMPEGFRYPARESLWVPLAVNSVTATAGAGRRVLVFGRLSDHADLDAARAEIAALGQRTAAQESLTHGHLRPDVMPYTIGLFPLPRGGLAADLGFYLIQGTTIAVLLIVCTNIAMLMLARTASRGEELAVRTALGASRGRIVAQLFTESLVLAVSAAAVGLFVADAIAERSLTWIQDAIPAWIDFGVDASTALLALALAAVSAAVVGVVPALKLTGGNVHENIQHAAAGRAGVRFGGFSSALIVADIALGMVAVAIAAGAWDTQPGGGLGLDADSYLTAELRLPGTVPGEDIAAFDPGELAARIAATQNGMSARLEAAPGLGRPAFATHLPGTDHPRRSVEIEGHDHGTSAAAPAPPRVRVGRVDHDYFAALDQPVLQGRSFRPADLDTPAPPVIVNTRFVEGVLRGQAAVGRRLRFTTRAGTDPGPWHEIVGVVGDLGLDVDNPQDAWGVYRLLPRGEMNPLRFLVRVDGPLTDAAPRLRALAAATDSRTILSAPVPLGELFSFDSYISRWLSAGVLAFIGAVLVLSAMSLYALMSFTVTQRTREVGIRTALGAGRAGVVRAIGARAALQLLLGFGIGVPVALRLLTWVGVATPRIAVALGADIVVLALVALTACLAPTLRALRIDPTQALRDGG